jgi:hypothetical protein
MVSCAKGKIKMERELSKKKQTEATKRSKEALT